MKSLYQYFEPTTGNSPLPSPNGPLSRKAINEANKEITKVLKDSEDKDGVKRRGTYQKYIPKNKVMIRNYAVIHRTSATLHFFKNKFSRLEVKVIVAKTRKSHKVITELEEKREEGQRCSLKISFPLL